MLQKRQTVNFKKNSFEHAAWENSLYIIGIDEVGRGCLAGPVVAAAVILPINTKTRLLKDSKEMTPQEREKAFAWIRKHCWYSTGIIHNRIIDQHNIWQATLQAMKKAVLHLMEITPHQPSTIVIDAMPLSLVNTILRDIPVHHFPFGESKSSSIAAASIVAKVTRDAMMRSLDTLIPGYKFVDNKGYGTVAHKTVLKTDHRSIIHRITYLNTIMHQQHSIDKQLSLDGLNDDIAGENDNETGKILCGSD